MTPQPPDPIDSQFNNLVTKVLRIVFDHLLSPANCVEAESTSYMTKDTDKLKNWPVIQEPVYILPKRVVDETLSDIRAALGMDNVKS